MADFEKVAQAAQTVCSEVHQHLLDRHSDNVILLRQSNEWFHTHHMGSL